MRRRTVGQPAAAVVGDRRREVESQLLAKSFFLAVRLSEAMWHLYLDESGDLGFDFQSKRPSTFLTIAVVATSKRETVDRVRTSVRRTLKNKVNRGKKNDQELKGSSTTIGI